ncbi:MAG: 5'/3'-nucleotidase SurE [Actinobacteria bacterium]|nr:5'/3'-nucleotidase SurE [Actinomycetota bacterium]
MTGILLTNDDGAGSPALVPFARALADLGEVRVCVPDRERSWIGKAITRTEAVLLEETTVDGHPVWTCSGYPADAAQLGIHELGDRLPDLVVSGINLGFNHGAAFLMSSGTVGAAVEGWISGIPAIAFSTGVWDGDWADWRARAESPEAKAAWEELAATCVTILRDLREADLFAHADVISVNLPFDATPATPRRVTDIARVGYDRLFRATGPGTYEHDFLTITRWDELAGTDVAVAGEGGVSITPVRLPRAAAVPDEVRRRVEG